MKIILDIETLPAQDPEVIAIWEENFKAPAQYKKPESIEKWKVDNRDSELLRTALNPDYGQICSIAYKIEQGDIEVKAGDEIEVLGWFVVKMEELLNVRGVDVGELEFVCHNAAFDLSYIWKRLTINDMFYSPKIRSALTKRYPLCTMTKWAGYGKFIGLNRLAKLLKIENKSGEGLQVFDWFDKGRWDEIEKYNAQDVNVTYQVARRLGVVR